ncbi:hypothetical protein SADUNF_Sadunf14G0026600 [Salix dunnii]|uniref:adenylate kinase n=1 Tax=Salix dunnii TaxID=1413687 RepID=A0A835JHA0_9ROSI|nr:hypothetical protein SADUNF_Sadunf14G0026600 [Salix dunnii]
MGTSGDAEKKPTVVFVLGGPGSGKGTQCANIVKHFGYTHLSAGDLLRAEMKSGSENGNTKWECLGLLLLKVGGLGMACMSFHVLFYLVMWFGVVLDFGTFIMSALTLSENTWVILLLVVYRTMIQDMIKEGKIVPSGVTIKLLQKAMQDSGNDKFLIDGFPRNEENRAAFEAVTKIEPAFVLFFDCPEEEMERRILSRNQGREDDNIETIRKRLKVYLESSLPVVKYYDSKGKVQKVDAAKSVDEVFEVVKVIFTPKDEKVKHHGCAIL